MTQIPPPIPPAFSQPLPMQPSLQNAMDMAEYAMMAAPQIPFTQYTAPPITPPQINPTQIMPDGINFGAPIMPITPFTSFSTAIVPQPSIQQLPTAQPPMQQLSIPQPPIQPISDYQQLPYNPSNPQYPTYPTIQPPSPTQSRRKGLHLDVFTASNVQLPYLYGNDGRTVGPAVFPFEPPNLPMDQTQTITQTPPIHYEPLIIKQEPRASLSTITTATASSFREPRTSSQAGSHKGGPATTASTTQSSHRFSHVTAASFPESSDTTIGNSISFVSSPRTSMSTDMADLNDAVDKVDFMKDDWTSTDTRTVYLFVNESEKQAKREKRKYEENGGEVEVEEAVEGRSKEMTEHNCFKCQCGKLFKKLYNLRNHYKQHSREKPYVCDVCKRGFMRKHDLKRHATTHMDNFKPYACDDCKMTFTRLDALHRHIKCNRCRAAPGFQEEETESIAA
ncbi:hypothetical protein HK097_008491 [Rhizophlyctis rosea]|uniref:C2H2-type domain-containing protein n=1 Tax=Rhizophlyctis rosea TaxID=64517 RepID=A0AAD5SJY2_9FUNG|nr:hypothetical protein HK097_008491 [Rhizophlyctis rosea]